MFAGWVLKLSEYNYNVEHASVPTADASSCAPSFETADEPGTSNHASAAPVDVLMLSERASVAAPIPVTLRTPKPPVFSLESVVEEVGINLFMYNYRRTLRQNSEHPRA